MYNVDEQDDVAELFDVPKPESGAPCPVVAASETSLAVEYYISPRFVREHQLPANDDGDLFAYVRFRLAAAHMFGPPNDEAFDGHPLAARGLRPYAVFEVRRSSWIRQLERMNRVHRMHKPEHYARYRHFVFAFHDTTFECVAESFEFELGKQARLSGPPMIGS